MIKKMFVCSKDIVDGTFKVPEETKTLDCSYSHNLKEIPNIIGLHSLRCSWCDNLKEIPIITTIKYLACQKSPIFNNKNIYGEISYNLYLNKIILFIYFLKYNRLSDALLRELMTKL